MLLLLGLGCYALQAPVVSRGLVALRASADQPVEAPDVVESAVVVEEDEMTEKQKEIARLRAAETFIQKETGVYICTVCNYKYDPDRTNLLNVAAGTMFADLPPNWRCPTCRATKDAFRPETDIIAGFATNQGYGFGGNSLSGESKNGLIFGGLGFFFLLFMSGYLLN